MQGASSQGPSVVCIRNGVIQGNGVGVKAEEGGIARCFCTEFINNTNENTIGKVSLESGVMYSTYTAYGVVAIFGLTVSAFHRNAGLRYRCFHDCFPSVAAIIRLECGLAFMYSLALGAGHAYLGPSDWNTSLASLCTSDLSASFALLPETGIRNVRNSLLRLVFSKACISLLRFSFHLGFLFLLRMLRVCWCNAARINRYISGIFCVLETCVHLSKLFFCRQHESVLCVCGVFLAFCGCVLIPLAAGWILGMAPYQMMCSRTHSTASAVLSAPYGRSHLLWRHQS